MNAGPSEYLLMSSKATKNNYQPKKNSNLYLKSSGFRFNSKSRKSNPLPLTNHHRLIFQFDKDALDFSMRGFTPNKIDDLITDEEIQSLFAIFKIETDDYSTLRYLFSWLKVVSIATIILLLVCIIFTCFATFDKEIRNGGTEKFKSVLEFLVLVCLFIIISTVFLRNKIKSATIEIKEKIDEILQKENSKKKSKGLRWVLSGENDWSMDWIELWKDYKYKHISNENTKATGIKKIIEIPMLEIKESIEMTDHSLAKTPIRTNHFY